MFAAHRSLPANAYCPRGQEGHDGAPVLTLENVPAEHCAQVETLTAPATVENVPAGHGVQLPLPEAEYEPAGHCWQLASVVEPVTLENHPAGQWMHDSLPSETEYLPAGHGMHEEDPAGAKNPAEQIWHTEAVVAPGVAEANPAGQSVQF